MLAWARRHIPEALLIPAGIGAGAVTVLSDIDELVPWGHELGIGVSQLAFAYVGAYIFNWLVVERPRAAALRGYYAAAWNNLMFLVRQPVVLVPLLYGFAGMVDPPPENPDPETLLEVVARIPWEDLDEISNSKEGAESGARFMFQAVIEQYRQAYESVAPIANFLEPQVAVAIANLHASPIHQYLARFAQRQGYLAVMANRQSQANLVQFLHEYLEAGSALLQVLKESRYIVPEDYWQRRFDRYSNLRAEAERDTPGS